MSRRLERFREHTCAPQSPLLYPPSGKREPRFRWSETCPAESVVGSGPREGDAPLLSPFMGEPDSSGLFPAQDSCLLLSPATGPAVRTSCFGHGPQDSPFLSLVRTPPPAGAQGGRAGAAPHTHCRPQPCVAGKKSRPSPSHLPITATFTGCLVWAGH